MATSNLVNVASNCLQTVLSVLLAFLLVLPAAAQVGPQNDPRRDNDPIVFLPGQAELLYRTSEEIPRQLGVIMRGCYENWLKDFPIRVIRPARQGQPIALATCGRIVASGVAFRIGRFSQPEPLDFIVMAPPRGFTTVRSPGYFEWDADTATLTAIQTTDICPHDEVRHIYGYSRAESPFTLLKIERRPAVVCSGRDVPWTIVFDAPDWPVK